MHDLVYFLYHKDEIFFAVHEYSMAQWLQSDLMDGRHQKSSLAFFGNHI